MLIDHAWEPNRLLNDGIHLNDEGCHIYAGMIWEDIARIPDTDGEAEISGTITEYAADAPCVAREENGDLTFTSLLPVAKKDVAFARILSTVIMQFVTLLLLNLFVVIKCAVPALSTPNVSGLDANIALNGIGLLIFGVFNIVFFIPYFTHPTKIGIPFLISSILTFVLIGSSVTLATAVPAYQTYIDTPDHSYVGYKLIVVAVGLIVYIVLTLLAVKISCKRFEKVNL